MTNPQVKKEEGLNLESVSWGRIFFSVTAVSGTGGGRVMTRRVPMLLGVLIMKSEEGSISLPDSVLPKGLYQV